MSYHHQLPMMPLRVLAQLYMFEPGHPKVPPGATQARLVAQKGNRLTLDYFDSTGRKLARRTAKWFQTAPIAAPFKTQVWWTKTGYWGPTVTPESEVGPVPMSRPGGMGMP